MAAKRSRSIKFPSVAEVAFALRRVNKVVDDDADVRLQLYENGEWTLHSGPSDYDLDHRGHWGSSSVPGGGRRFRSEETARDLIEQARESVAMRGDSSDRQIGARRAARGVVKSGAQCRTTSGQFTRCR